MKTTILAIILALSICGSAYMLKYNPDLSALTEKMEELEADMDILLSAVEITVGDMARIESRFETNNAKIQKGFAELKELLNREYTYIIPISEGFLGIIEKPLDKP